MSDDTTDVTLTTRKKKIHWSEPFETEILNAVLAPRIRAILHEGVRNRSHLLEKWAEKFGGDPGHDRMQRWLEQLGYGALFGNKPLIRVPMPEQAPAMTESSFRGVMNVEMTTPAPAVGSDGLPSPRMIAPSVVRTRMPNGQIIEIPGIGTSATVTATSVQGPEIRDPLNVPGMSGSVHYTSGDFANDGPPGITING
jgi:hypothetical protein